MGLLRLRETLERVRERVEFRVLMDEPLTLTLLLKEGERVR
jgi:hypothetical protein